MAKKRQEKAKVLLLTPERKIVVLWRSSKANYRPGEIDLPGGRQDKGEKPRHTVIRETLEETGIILDPKALAHLRRHRSRSKPGKITDIFAVGLPETPADGQIVLSDEHQDQGLMTEAEFLASNIAEKYKIALRENPQKIGRLFVPSQAQIEPVQFEPVLAPAQPQAQPA